MKQLLVLILAACLAGCGDSIHETKDESAKAYEAKQAEANADNIDNYKKLIIGEWVSDDDPENKITITAIHYIDITDTFEYTLTNTNCMDNSSDATTVYLQTDLCYSINKLDENNLTLTYLDRGNTLSYRRVK